MTIAALAVAFFVTALLYSSVGFGGGSTYNALLALGVADISTVPVVALTCNILVVAIGSWRFIRGGHVEWSQLWPLVILSVPAALLGGYLTVPAWLFVGLLALALAISGLLMLWQRTAPAGRPTSRAAPRSGCWPASPASAEGFIFRHYYICAAGRAPRRSPVPVPHSSW